MTRHFDDSRCLFDDERNPDELYESIINDIEQNYNETINWRKAKAVLDYIKEACDGDEDPGEIYENAMHQLDELNL